MSERRISCNIRRIFDLLTLTENEVTPALIVSIDFEKAFDRVEFEALFKSLEYFDLHEDFIKWTRIVYQKPKAVIVNNGYFTNYINLERGLRQGGPCSAYYFLLIAEILAIEIRKNPKIKSVMILNIDNLLGQYTDDIDLYVFGQESPLWETFQVFDRFTSRTGFKINYDKTTIYRIGSLHKSKAILYTSKNVKWENNGINVLGVEISYTEILQKNYLPLINKLPAILNAWSKRGLNLLGKVMIVNTLIASLFVYKMSVLPLMSDVMIKEINKQVTWFLWDSKTPKISLATLQLAKKDGGVSLVDFKLRDQALKAEWVKIITTDQMVAQCAYKTLKVEGTLENLIWKANIIEKDIKTSFKASFWRDVLSAWMRYQAVEPLEKNEICNQLIWYNSYIKVQGKLICYKKALDAGLMYVSQLFHSEGGLISCEDSCRFFDLTVMQWNSLITAIPKAWKCKLSSQIGYVPSDDKYENFLQKPKTVKLYYELMLRE